MKTCSNLNKSMYLQKKASLFFILYGNRIEIESFQTKEITETKLMFDIHLRRIINYPYQILAKLKLAPKQTPLSVKEKKNIKFACFLGESTALI